MSELQNQLNNILGYGEKIQVLIGIDKDGKETETVLFTKTDGYKFDFLDGKYSVMVNVPTTVNKIRVKITPGKSSAFNTSYNSVDTYGLALVSAKDW